MTIADRGGVKIEGVRRLRSTLKAAGADLGDFRTLHLQVAGIVATRTRNTAPIGPEAGGHIRDTVRPGATRVAAIVRVGNKAKPYGPAIHWGWPRRSIAGNPWVSVAAQQTEPQWLEIYWTGLINIISKIRGA